MTTTLPADRCPLSDAPATTLTAPPRATNDVPAPMETVPAALALAVPVLIATEPVVVPSWVASVTFPLAPNWEAADISFNVPLFPDAAAPETTSTDPPAVAP